MKEPIPVKLKGWPTFQCEECDTKFSVHTHEVIDEPICPVCSSDNVRDGEGE